MEIKQSLKTVYGGELIGRPAVFIREKKSGERYYLPIVENQRENGKTCQHVIATQ